MFNYRNLDDIEFEELCKDVMGRKLNTTLRSFRRGVDGGIDLKDNDPGYNIVVQVKHYINSKFPDLRNSLRKEVGKVQLLNPNKYYVCCAQELGPSDIKEIYELFNDYMDTEENIITLKEIDDFLHEETNIDIVRKHFKLWLCSSNILSEINNQNIFIDCENLLSDIKEESKYYVQTKTYDESIKILEELGCLMLVGSPGVGKTTISKMTVLYYASLGYRIKYTTNGDITDIKKSLSTDRDAKEIVLLDDCLGQTYFKMKETQDSELISLVQHVKNNKNKKIILNSRITIFNEAKAISQEFKSFVISKKINVYVIDMDIMNEAEKARIFYNHLYFNKVPNEYYMSVRKNMNYLKIINHRNYNPRIIEYVTQIERYKDTKAEAYFDFILSKLDNPEDVWKIEYEKRIEPIDRIFMITLFSLTDTTVSEKVLEECFNKRLIKSNIDTTVNNFKNILNRLNRSMVKIIDNNGNKEISVLNPSINDYLKKVFYNNEIELDKIKKSIIFYDQIERCYFANEVINIIKEKIENNKFLCLKINKSSRYNNLEDILLDYISEYKILNSEYKLYIKRYIENMDDDVANSIIIERFLDEPLYSYYELNKCIIDKNIIVRIYSCMNLEQLPSIVNLMYLETKRLGDDGLLEELCSISIGYIIEKIEDYIEQNDIDDFMDRRCLNDYFNDIYEEEEPFGEQRIIDNAIIDLYNELKEEIKSLLNGIENELDVKAIKDQIVIYINSIDLDEYSLKEDVISYANNWLEPDDDYESHDEDDILGGNTSSSEDSEFDEIEMMFDRDI